ncbi:MAG: TetR/AcrR family transcriptional regulator [Candidatus Eisenbacteria bacterium]
MNDSSPAALLPPDPESTQGRILAAGRECFARSGFEGTTTRAIAEAAGVNLALVHYHFGSKEALYRRVIAGEMVQVLGTIATAMQRQDKRPAERLLDLVGLVHRAFREDPVRLAIIRKEIGQGAPHGIEVVRALGENGPQGFRRLAIDVIEEAQEAGEIAPGDPRAILGLIITGAYGMLFVGPMLGLIFDNSWSDDEQWQEMLDGQRKLLERAICVQAPR